MEVNINSFTVELFDFIRIVDPISNKVINEFGENCLGDNRCYNFFENSDICKNCISIKALKYGTEVFTKIEKKNKDIYLVMGKRIQYKDKWYVIEAIKDISKSSILDNISKYNSRKIQEKFDKMSILVALDELTECFNRRYLNEKLPIEIDKAIKHKRDLAIIMLDIDFFKQINDKYGHLAGDYVLKKLVKVIKKNIRASVDWVARYGGEEFVIILNGIKSENAIRVAEKIRYVIENTIFIYKEFSIKVTVSLGVTNLTDDTNSKEKLLEKVDKNLYKAKSKGRNMCISDKNFFD